MNVNNLIGTFYEAALAPERWRAGLEGLRELGGAQGASLIYGSPSAATTWVAVEVGHPAASKRDYDGYFHSLDPLVPHGLRHPTGTWLNDWRMEGPAYAKTEYYNDFMHAHGWHSCLAVLLERDQSFMAAASLQRTRGNCAFGTEDEQRLGQVITHMSRAFRLYKEAEILRRRSSLAQAALESIDTAIWLVDSVSRVILCNSLADRIVVEGKTFIQHCNTLRSAQGDTTSFAKAVQLATNTLGPRASWVQVGDKRRIATVLPIPPQAQSNVGLATRLAAVLVKSNAAASPKLEDALRTLYGLTKQEASVARCVGDGLAPKEIGDHLGLSTETVRSYLKVVFSKTGFRRQVDLSRALNSLAMADGGVQ